MPRKYDKKTKANFRAGRRNSRRASMRVSMVSPGLSMFDEEFDPSIDDTMLMLKAKGIDRERERFAEALTEVRDRISRIVDDYDAALDESAYIYKDYIGELQEQASVMPGSKLKHNILRILADYKFVCVEREELLHALQENMNAQQSSMSEVPTYFDDHDEFDFFTSNTCLREYTKTVRWFTEKFKDMDARVCLMKKRELASKGEKKRMRKEKQKEKEKEKEKAKVTENIERLDPTNSKERLETWKYAAEEIVDLLNTIRQEGEGGKGILANELQKIMNIMNKQNEEIVKKTEMVQKEKESTLKMKQNRDKLQVQIGNLEAKFKAKQGEVAACKQYIRDIGKKMKTSPGEVKFVLEGMEEDDLKDELPTVIKRRFTLTQSSVEDDFERMKLKEYQQKASDLHEENTRLQEEITKFGELMVQKDKELAELKAMLSDGDGLSCPRCQRLTGSPSSEDDAFTQQKIKLDILEQKLQESESKLETTVVDLARMRINLASSGINLPDLVNVSSQTPVNDEEMLNEDEIGETDSSHSSLHEEEEEESRPVSRAGSDLAKFVVTEASPLVGDTVDEPEVSNSQATQRSSKKKKRKRMEKKDHSRKPSARSLAHPDVDREDVTTDGISPGTKVDSDVDVHVIRSTISLKRNVVMENKAVQTVHGGVSSAYGRSPLQRDAVRSIPGSRTEAREHMEDFREEITMLPGGKMEFESGWRATLHKLCSNIENILDDTEAGGQLERMLSLAMTGGKKEFRDDRCKVNARPTDEQFVQDASTRRKSIFLRLVENNDKNRGSVLSPIHDARYNRSRSIHTPQYTKIKEEPDASAPNAHLPALPVKHRSKTSKHSSSDTADFVQATNETSKPTPSEESQASGPGKQSAGILKHTPPKHADSHPPSHPKDDMKGKVRKQSLTFGGDDDVKTSYNKPFRARRKSVFGHADVLEKLSSSTGLEPIRLSEESKYIDGVQPYQEDDRYYDSEYAERSPSTPDRPFDAQQLRYRRMSRGQFRPSMHPFIGLSEKDRESLSNIYHARKNAGSRRNLDYEDEESEIEVGKLLNDYSRDSLRKAFLSLGLMHLKGDSDDVKADERLTMEDQVNIVAQMAMEVLKATCDVFSRSRRESQAVPDQQLYKTSASDDEELEETGDRESILPPVNTPESRIVFEDEPKDSTDDKDEETLLPELSQISAAVDTEIKDPKVSETKRSSINRSRQGSEQRHKDIFARYATKQRSLNRPNPFRTTQSRKTVMERILGSQISAFGNMLGSDNPRFTGGMKSHRSSLVRQSLMDDEEFTLTAQAIKLPKTQTQTQATHQRSLNPQHLRPATKPTPQGILKSSSMGAPVHGLTATGLKKYTQAIAKARSDQTHNRLFIGSRTQEQPRWPPGRMRHPGLRKRM